MSKRAYSVEFKMKVITVYKNEIYSISELCSTFNVTFTTIKNWISRYEKYGIDGLKESKTWKRYSKELKLAAIKDFESSQYSLREIIKNIRYLTQKC